MQRDYKERKNRKHQQHSPTTPKPHTENQPKNDDSVAAEPIIDINVDMSTAVDENLLLEGDLKSSPSETGSSTSSAAPNSSSAPSMPSTHPSKHTLVNSPLSSPPLAVGAASLSSPQSHLLPSLSSSPVASSVKPTMSSPRLQIQHSGVGLGTIIWQGFLAKTNMEACSVAAHHIVGPHIHSVQHLLVISTEHFHLLLITLYWH